MNNRKGFNDTILHKARRGLALAALFVFATTAGVTWLASERAEARPAPTVVLPAVDASHPAAGKLQVGALEDDSERPVRTAGTDEPLTKNGKVLSGKLNLNTATEDELQMLPGIGTKKAQRIVEYRTKHGKFKRVRDLRRVKGFGYKTVTKLAPYLTTEGKSTLEAT